MNIYFDSYEGVDNTFNLGETTRQYADRHKDGDYGKANQLATALDTKYVNLGWWTDFDGRDHNIHKWLGTLPHFEKIGRETFRFNKNSGLTLDIVKDMIEQKFFTDTVTTKIDLKLRDHQSNFVNKARKDYDEFLLFAKCRAGKSVMTLSHIVDRGFKVSLVVSRYTSPMQSWRDDSKSFSNFDNLVFVDVNDKNYIQQLDYWYNTDKQIILWGCIQSRKLLDLPVDVDLLVYDEAHVGYNSNQWVKLKDATKCPVLYVTGTAYKMVWDFADSDRFIYSYFEEQLDKKKGKIDRPSMNVILAKYQSAKYQSVFGDDPDAMKNLFNVEDDKFTDPALVQEFVSNYFDTQRHLRSKDRLLKDATHLYITLPSVSACHAFQEYLSGTRFKPLVVTGETGKDALDINNHIEENPNGSAILTRCANVLGVTASKVDTIINCAEGSSIEFWTQFAFRGGSSDNDWNVIDFVPQRCLESLRQTFVATCDTTPEVSEYELTDFIVISEWSEGFTTLSTDRVNEILSADVGNAIRLVSGLASSLNFNKLRDLDFNLELEPCGNNVTKSVVLNDNNGNGKTNKVRVNELNKSERDELYQKIDTIQSILERIPLVLYHAINSGEMMNNIDSVIESDHYEPVTLDDEQIVKKALDYDVIDRQALSYRISRAYVDVQNAIQSDRRQTLSVLSESTQSQQDIPLDLLDQMLSV